MNKISVVVPCFNEEEVLSVFYKKTSEVLNEIEDITYELLFVDDGSKDESYQIMNQIREMDKNVKCVKLSRNFGEHAALLAGLSVCTGDCAVTKQADLQEDSEIILEMYESWKKGNKVVLAVRASRDENAIKKFFANLYYIIVRKFINDKMPAGGCDCYLIDRQVIKVLELLDEKNSSLTLQVLWAGFQTDCVCFHRKDREVGVSRWTLGKKIKLAMDSMMSFSYVPIRLMSGLGIVFFIVSILMAIGVIVEKIAFGTPMLGWSSLMCVVLFSFGVIMLMMGVLGEY